MSVRITNCQRAALCAMILAGQPFIGTCRMLGVSERAMKAVLHADWHRGTRQPRKWTDDQLKRLRQAYFDERTSRDACAKLFGISKDMLRLLARKHGWKRSRRRKAALTRREMRSHKRLEKTLGAQAALALLNQVQRGWLGEGAR
jgi:hypothetical protein